MSPEEHSGGVLLGIDGGGSKTTALLAHPDGRVIARGTSGASNYQSTGLQASLAEIDRAVQQAREKAENAPVTAVCLGMAGVDRPEDRAPFSGWVAVRFPGAKVRLVSDAHLVLAAGAGSAAGVALISGTGSIAYAQDGHGNTARAGGWGYLLGDEGSGYKIGMDGLRAVTQAWDEIGPTTALTWRMLAELDIASPPELVRKIYREPMSRAEIAKLAGTVVECAQAGDAAAIQIMREAAAHLARFAAVAARKLKLEGPLPCAMAGGLLVHTSTLRESVIQHARAAGIELAPVTVVEEPASGAIVIAQGL